MKFIKYTKIENSYRPEFIERIRLEGMDKGDWVVTEKVHGSSFSIWVNTTRTKIAKRTGYLDDGKNFFNVFQIAHELKEKAREVFQNAHTWNGAKEVVIYGELCGGCYPHPKVTPNSQFKKVQDGIWYSPKLEFLVYDVKVDGEFLNVWEMEEYAWGVDFDIVPFIAEGTFPEMIKIRNDYVSRIPKMFELPIIKDNTMEGIVIRPVLNGYLRRGERVILKSKNAKWSEKRFHKPRRTIKLTGMRKKFASEALNRINENRYDSAVSKMGDVEPKDFGKIMGVIIQDIHSEMIDDCPKLYMQFQELAKTERKLIHRVLSPEIATIIRKKLLGIGGLK